MAYTPQQLKQAIENGLPDSVAYIEDTKGTGDHFNAVVICPEFEGKSAVEQHRMVHRAMQEIIEGDLHALHLKTLTPAAAERAGYHIA
ncbi:MAG: BolA/IbaG family iron-sulfur metabolism protein [Armatimonadetes bacterium]|nr:BolA/IbaG family iron-sulfur metabolism protein [Armatimonadota bacterium]